MYDYPSFVPTIGSQAPDFVLDGVMNGKYRRYSLKDYKNKWLVVFFYPLDFTFICPTEIREFSRKAGEFRKVMCEIVGVSVDSKESHKAWIERDFKGKLAFPLLSDFQRIMINNYGVHKTDEGVAYRGTFIIDPKGILRHITISDNDVGRSVEETLRVVKALQTGKLCPVEWHPGQKTLN
ncbi:MAG TPA: peroxiredoxin [Candidatus Paceibacterota bacterium]